MMEEYVVANVLLKQKLEQCGCSNFPNWHDVSLFAFSRRRDMMSSDGMESPWGTT